MSITFIIVIGIIFYILFAIIFLYIMSKRTGTYQARKIFFTALDNVMRHASTTSEQIRQVNLHFKKLAETNNYVSRELQGPEDLIEQFIYILDTRGERFFKRLELDITPEDRQKILDLLAEMREKNPFSSLPSREANVMSALAKAIEAKNEDLSTQLLRQLAQEIEKTDKALRVQQRKNNTAYAVSTMGFALTTVFGIMSIVLAFY